MKRSLKQLALLALPLALSSLANAQTTTEPVGVVKISIEAAAAADQPTFTFLSTSMSAELAYQGVVSAGAAGTITIGSDDWTASQFESVPYYVLVASGAREGEILDIASNTVNTLTLTITEDQSDLVGATIRIHKHNTIASIFGADPAAGTVQKGNRDTADHIQIYNPLTATYKIYYFNTATNPLPVGGTFHQGWVSDIALTEDAANTPIYPDDGFIYKRVPTSGFDVNVNGQVITNQIKVPLISGYNLVCLPYPVDKSITLATSGLRPANPGDFDINTHLQAGNRDTADHVLIYDSATKVFKIYYYNNATNTLPVGGTFHQGWVSDIDLTTDASSTSIPAGSGIFILRRAGAPAFNWVFQDVTE